MDFSGCSALRDIANLLKGVGAVQGVAYPNWKTIMDMVMEVTDTTTAKKLLKKLPTMCLL